MGGSLRDSPSHGVVPRARHRLRARRQSHRGAGRVGLRDPRREPRGPLHRRMGCLRPRLRSARPRDRAPRAGARARRPLHRAPLLDPRPALRAVAGPQAPLALRGDPLGARARREPPGLLRDARPLDGRRDAAGPQGRPDALPLRAGPLVLRAEERGGGPPRAPGEQRGVRARVPRDHRGVHDRGHGHLRLRSGALRAGLPLVLGPRGPDPRPLRRRIRSGDRGRPPRPLLSRDRPGGGPD